jgi:hypothetical protein
MATERGTGRGRALRVSLLMPERQVQELREHVAASLANLASLLATEDHAPHSFDILNTIKRKFLLLCRLGRAGCSESNCRRGTIRELVP